MQWHPYYYLLVVVCVFTCTHEFECYHRPVEVRKRQESLNVSFIFPVFKTMSPLVSAMLFLDSGPLSFQMAFLCLPISAQELWGHRWSWK